jgi:hypothetical protein
MSPALQPAVPRPAGGRVAPGRAARHNRCILCELCVRASAQMDGKSVFALSGRGITKHLIVNAESGRLGDTQLATTDKALDVCPVGDHPAQADRFPRAHRPAHVRRAAHQPRHRGPKERAPPKIGRQVMPSSARRREAPRRHDLARRVLRLPHVVPRHRRAPDRAARAHRVRLARPDRHQVTGPCDLGLVEGGLCNAENVHVLRNMRSRSAASWWPWGPARSTAGCPPSATTSTSATACRRCT